MGAGIGRIVPWWRNRLSVYETQKADALQKRLNTSIRGIKSLKNKGFWLEYITKVGE